MTHVKHFMQIKLPLMGLLNGTKPFSSDNYPWNVVYRDKLEVRAFSEPHASPHKIIPFMSRKNDIITTFYDGTINKLLQDLNKILKVSDILQFKVHHDFKSKPTHATHNTARTEHFGSRSVYANTGDILMGPFTYKPWLFGEYAMFCSTNLSLIMTKTKQHDMSDVRIDITDKEMILSKHHNSFMTILKNIPLSKGKGYNIMTICGVFLNHKEQQSMMNIL
eukprot:805533_1